MVTEDDLAAAATPELRKKLECMQKLDAYNLVHPMDPRPMRQAAARGDVDAAVEEALKYGLEIGRRAGMFGLDAVAGRKYLQQQRAAWLKAAVSRKAETEVRLGEWRANMEDLHRKHPTLSGRQLAKKLVEQYQAEDEDDAPSQSRLENLWVEWRPRE